MPGLGCVRVRAPRVLTLKPLPAHLVPTRLHSFLSVHVRASIPQVRRERTQRRSRA